MHNHMSPLTHHTSRPLTPLSTMKRRAAAAAARAHHSTPGSVRRYGVYRDPHATRLFTVRESTQQELQPTVCASDRARRRRPKYFNQALL